MHRKLKKPLTFLIIKNPPINQHRINRKRNTCIQYILVDKRTPQQIPIGIQYKQQPPPKQKTNQASKAMIERNAKHAIGHKEEKPEKIKTTNTCTQQEKVQQIFFRYRQQFIGFNLLSRSLLKSKTQQKIYRKKKYGPTINHIIGLNARSCKSKIEHHSKKHQIYRPKTDEHIGENFHCHIAFKHRMTLLR